MSLPISELGRRTLVMGIVNATPDSFSDGGRFVEAQAAIAHGRALFAEGADLVDVGGESTRPGAEPVSEDEELRRVVPVVEALAQVGPVSIDTYKARVADAALERGAVLVNDISGLRFEPEIADVAARHRAGLVVSHTLGRPQTMQDGTPQYPDGVVETVFRALQAGKAQALAAGVADGGILVDPGIGFGKTLDHNLELLRHLPRLAELGPVLVGTSRKSFLGKLTRRPLGERGYATAATVALAVQGGAAMVRVHDVRDMVDVVRVADAWVRGR